MSSPSSPARLSAGDPAPGFSLPAVMPGGAQQEVALADFRGRPVLLYCYPAAMTPGCTRQAVDFRDNLSVLDGAGLAVLGLSPDPPAKLARFIAAEQLTFPLLSDPERTVLSAYGAYGPKTMYGRTVTGVIRSTFLIAPDGTVDRALYNVRATGHVAKLLRELGLTGDGAGAAGRQ